MAGPHDEVGRQSKVPLSHQAEVFVPAISPQTNGYVPMHAGLGCERSRAPRVVEGVKCGEHLGPDEVFTRLLRGEHQVFTQCSTRCSHAPSTRSERTDARGMPIHTHLPRARSMTMSLCVLALHGWVAKDGNYSEKIGGECGGSGCGWSCMVLYANFRDRQHPTVQNLKPHGFQAAVLAIIAK